MLPQARMENDGALCAVCGVTCLVEDLVGGEGEKEKKYQTFRFLT